MEVGYCLRGDGVFGLRREHERDEDVEAARLGLAGRVVRGSLFEGARDGGMNIIDGQSCFGLVARGQEDAGDRICSWTVCTAARAGFSV